MAKCLRCGAGNEWIQGKVRNETDSDNSPKRQVDARGSHLKDLIGALDQYIKLLDDELIECVMFASLHGWKSSRVEVGKKQRRA